MAFQMYDDNGKLIGYACDLCDEVFASYTECEKHEQTAHMTNWKNSENNAIANELECISRNAYNYATDEGTIMGYFANDFENMMLEAANRIRKYDAAESLKDHVHVDFTRDIIYGSDQTGGDYPVRFATVCIPLFDTPCLSRIADRIRKNKGYVPMYPLDEYTDETCDFDGWYDFSYKINGDKWHTSLNFIVCHSGSDDNGESYTINLTDTERLEIYLRIDAQCRERLVMGCKELLKEAVEKMAE